MCPKNVCYRNCWTGMIKHKQVISFNIFSTELTMFHMVRAVPRMATMRAASLKSQTIMAARVAPTMVTPAKVRLSFLE